MIKQMIVSIGSWKKHRMEVLADPSNLADMDQRVAHAKEALRDAGVAYRNEPEAMALIAGTLYVYRAALQWSDVHQHAEFDREEFECLMAWLTEAAQTMQEVVFREHDRPSIKAHCVCGGHDD